MKQIKKCNKNLMIFFIFSITICIVWQNNNKKEIRKEIDFFDSSLTIMVDGSEGSWNYDAWQPLITNLNQSGTKCSFAFQSLKNLSNAIDNDFLNQKKSLAKDEFSNIHYIGLSPNNYVSFNDELWRIVGVYEFDGIRRVKIMRDESIAIGFSWDSSASDVNNGVGINEWSQADLMNLLNKGAYFNRTSGYCFYGYNDTLIPCDFTETGLQTKSKEMIAPSTWFLGTSNQIDYNEINKFMVKEYYAFERGNLLGKQCTNKIQCTDTVERYKSWVGNIGLISVSDYGYAIDIQNREICLSIPMESWKTTNKECFNNNWLRKNDAAYWTLNPISNANTNALVTFLYGKNILMTGNAGNLYQVFPSLYLKENIKLYYGLGTKENPYRIAF